MKKIYTSLIVIFIFLFCTSKVNAISLKVIGPSLVKRTDEITVYITLDRNSDEKIVSAVDGKLNYDTNIFTLVESDIITDKWTVLSEIGNNRKFSYANLEYNNLITNNSQNIAKAIFKVNEKASDGDTIISISDASITDEEGSGMEIEGGQRIIRVLSDINTLNNITVSNTNIAFDENITNYNLAIDSSTTTIEVLKKDDNSTVTGDIGTKELEYGLNTLKITVTSESGLEKTYILNITRLDNRSKDNTLSNLKLSAANINFNRDTLNYNLTVENNISNINIEATLSNSKSSFVERYEPRKVALGVGKNIIEIRVQAENEEIKTYTVNITRKDKKITTEEKKSSNNYLSILKIKESYIVFNKELLEYQVSIPYDVQEINLELKTEHPTAKTNISGNKNLKVGKNITTVTVTAEDGNIREYKILVIRKEKEQILSNNSKLKSLIIKNYEINFDSNKYIYNIKINDESSLNITYTKDDSK